MNDSSIQLNQISCLEIYLHFCYSHLTFNSWALSYDGLNKLCRRKAKLTWENNRQTCTYKPAIWGALNTRHISRLTVKSLIFVRIKFHKNLFLEAKNNKEGDIYHVNISARPILTRLSNVHAIKQKLRHCKNFCFLSERVKAQQKFLVQNFICMICRIEWFYGKTVWRHWPGHIMM